MFTWSMDHGYEIITLAVQPPEPKHAKCINTDEKKGCLVPFTNATRNPEIIFPNSFFGFIFTRPINMDLDPSFPQNPLNKNEETNLIYYSEMIGFYTRF